MLKSLFLMSSVVSMIGAVPDMDHTPSTINNASEISVSYQYETNEVNSVDDLIDGNIYKYHYTSDIENVSRIINCTYVHIDNTLDLSINFDDTNIRVNTVSNSTYGRGISITFEGPNTSQNIIYLYDALLGNNYYIYFVWYSNGYMPSGNLFIDRISASDYLGEPIIEEKEITGLYDIINNWFYDYLYDTEQLNSYSVEFMGSCITLSSYLSMVSTIACLILLTIVLILFIKWLFNLFSGLLRF